MVLLVAVSSARRADEHSGPRRASATVLVFHGGGFVLGSPQATRSVARTLARRGFAVVNVEYPLLAARGMVAGAVAWAPVSDLLGWPGAWLFFRDYRVPFAPTLRRLSPITWARGRSSPLMILHGRSDLVGADAQSRRLVARWPRAVLCSGPGGHTLDGATFLWAQAHTASILARLASPSRRKLTPEVCPTW